MKKRFSFDNVSILMKKGVNKKSCRSRWCRKTGVCNQPGLCTQAY